MSSLADHINEMKAAGAFTKQSTVFDQLYAADAIIQYKRKRVRDHILTYAKPRASMLELNCGTGEDAIFFAQKGCKVHATDLSGGMIKVLRNKVVAAGLQNAITTEQCSFTELELLQKAERYDYVYSNFGGLNCTSELKKVLGSMDDLVNPGGYVTLVIISNFCLWETVMLFKGKFRTALRRFSAARGRKARVEGAAFTCWYYSPAFVQKHIGEGFELQGIEGLCTLVPPSYIENFATRYPKIFQFLARKENSWKDRWPWKYMGDYFVVSFRKK